MNHLFEKILFESRIKASRHFSKDEANEICSTIKKAIQQNNIEFINRDKNRDFLKQEKLTINTAFQLLEYYLTPKNLIAVVDDRNREGNELYIFSLPINYSLRGQNKVKWIYVKINVNEHGRVKIISFHNQNEKMHTDYRQSSDGQDDYLNHLAFKWAKRIKSKIGKRLIEYSNDEENIYLTFDHLDDYEKIKYVIADEVPFDFGYKTKIVLKNMEKIDENLVKIYLPY